MRFRFVILFLISALLFTACSLERKYAREFIKQKKHKVAVMLVPPGYLNMYNNTQYILDSTYITEDFPLDSLLFQQTKLLKQVSDSVFLENYLNGFIKGLRQIGFQVFLPDEIEAFKETDASAYVFKFAQVELSEEIDPFTISEEVSGTKFYKAFDLNLITLSNWFEFEARDTAWRKVFFAEDAVVDEIKGDVFVDKIKKSPVLYYEMDSLSVEEVYVMATDAGKKYAGFFTDYLMNTYIESHFPKGLSASVLFHYEAEFRLFLPLMEGEGFHEVSIAK